MKRSFPAQYRMNLKTALFSLLLFFSLPGTIHATHIAGAEITYQHISGNQYNVCLNLFVDCGGFDPGASQTINIESNCGSPVVLNVTVDNPGGTEISQICPGQIGNTSCHGGSLPGMWIFKYSDTVALPYNCNTWTMTWGTCCRNSSITNIQTPSSFGTQVHSSLNSMTDSANSSPYFTAATIPYVCQGQPVNYSCGVVEPDGDSLYFSLIDAEDTGGTALLYNAGYSGSSPIPGLTIDPISGQLSFTPLTIGNFVVVVQVEEFDANANLLGSVMRDIQFVVHSCSNNAPSLASGNISNLSGAGVQRGARSLYVCPGESFACDLVYTDVDAADTLSFLSNILFALPGATVIATGVNPLVLHVSWTAPAAASPLRIPVSVSIQDNACPVFGIQSFVYIITVIPHMVITGTASFAGSPVDGYARLISHDPGIAMRIKDSVVISGGNYAFPFVLPGSYLIQATPDTTLYPLAVPTYYDTVIAWSDAQNITMAPLCNDTARVDVTLLGHGSAIGTNDASGTLLEGTGYSRTAGAGLGGINVFLLENVSGNIIGYTASDASGHYHFGNVPAGCFRIYVDIPGLPMDSTYHLCVNSGDNIGNLNFIADANSIFITNSALNIAGNGSNMSSMTVYPNPASDDITIECFLAENTSVTVTVYNSLGEKVLVPYDHLKQEGMLRLHLRGRSQLAPGVYFIHMSTGTGNKIQKLVITE